MALKKGTLSTNSELIISSCVAKYKPQETLGKFPMRLSARSVETRVLAIVRLVKVISLVSLEIKRFV